jgi:DNA-binding XRE family transcriptional regulator
MKMLKNNQLVMEIDPSELEPETAQDKALAASLESFRELQNGLFDIRIATNLTQAELADRLGCSQPMVSKIEASQAGIRVGTLLHYAASLGLAIKFEVEPITS